MHNEGWSQYFQPMHHTRTLIASLLFACLSLASAQVRIDGTFAFQSDTAKKYSLYIPSSYAPGVDHRLMVAFHPFNTSVWTAKSWCDTLTTFAEANGLLMACPDGGADGQVDDPIDTAFTTALLDSVRTWYNIDPEKTYVMGFSWGARTAYTYGLLRPGVFNGYLPIGAAITNLNEVNPTMVQNSAGKPVYIVHGSSDSPNTRFYPVRDALIGAGAIVDWLLMSGVGHTINFPNRNAILGVAFHWIDSVNCANLTLPVPAVGDAPHAIRIFPSVVAPMGQLSVELPAQDWRDVLITLVDHQGRIVHEYPRDGRAGLISLMIPNLAPGSYMLRATSAKLVATAPFTVVR